MKIYLKNNFYFKNNFCFKNYSCFKNYFSTNYFLKSLFLLLLISGSTVLPHSKSWFGNFGSWFKASKKQIVKKDYKIDPYGVVLLTNFMGNISVEGSEGDRLFLEAVKIGKETDLPNIKIDVEVSGKRLKIETKSKRLEVKEIISKDFAVAVDYKIKVPKTVSLHIKNGRGNIRVKDINGKISIKNGTDVVMIGDIDEKINSSADTTTKSSDGEIFIKGADGDIRMEGINGNEKIDIDSYGRNIIIKNSSNSVAVKAHKGKILLEQKLLRKDSTIFLVSKSSVTLKLPIDIDANIDCKTLRGSILSELYVTLEQITSKLTTTFWKNLRRSVKGTIGSGGSEIIIDVTRGDIKLLEK